VDDRKIIYRTVVHWLWKDRIRFNERTPVLAPAHADDYFFERIRRHGCPVYAIDDDPERVKRLNERGVKAIRGLPGHSYLTVAKEAFSVAFTVLPPGDDLESAYHRYATILWMWNRLVKDGILVAMCETPGALIVARDVLRRFELRAEERTVAGVTVLVLKKLPQARRVPKEDERLADMRRGELAKGIPPTPQANPRVEPFRSKLLDEEAVLEAMRRSPLASEMLRAAARAREARDEVPPLPLKPGHLALQLATGRFDGVVGEGDDRHVVLGQVVRTKVPREEVGDDGEVTTVEEDRLSVVVTALTADGRLKSLSSDDGKED
jgi:hypothetical protein